MSDVAGFLLGLAISAAISTGLCWLVWRFTRDRSVNARAWIRATAIAFFFSPTFFACGGASLVPFPLLVSGEIHVLLTGAENPCGPQVLMNLPIVAVVFVLVAAGLRNAYRK